jgi:predicted glutamine amidotransferase
MCVIIAKNKRDRLPTDNELKQCFNHNRDGAGFMYTDKGQVIIDKGYMTLDSFMARYVTLCKKYNDFKDKSLVIHCRIGTAGSSTAQNTHPYPVTKSVAELHKTYVKTHLGVAHNGIIRDFNPDKEDGDVNDTQNFIRIYLTRKYKEDHKFYKRQFERDYIEEITSSKFAILDSQDNLYTVGSFVTENGLKFSNDYFKPYVPKYTTPYDEDDFWEDYELNYAARRASHTASTTNYKWNSKTGRYEHI